LFNPHTPSQLKQIRLELARLLNIIEAKDSEAMRIFLQEVRKRV
jgi:prephenate dehydrogenase